MSALLGAVGELGREHPAKIWVTFFEHIAQYERLYRALLGSSGSPWFVRKMRAALSGLIRERGSLPHGPNASARSVHAFSDAFVDRKSTRLNSSHQIISYAVFCLKKKNEHKS